MKLKSLTKMPNYNLLTIRTQIRDYYKYSFYPRTITEWNKLPRDIALYISLAAFKNAFLNIYQHFYYVACVQTITKLWLVPSAKQRRDPCSGPPTDSTNYRKCVSISPSTWLAITTNKTKPFLTGHSWRVRKSGYTAGSPEQGFRRCFADGVNQSLISSARRLLLRCAHKRHFSHLFFRAV